MSRLILHRFFNAPRIILHRFLMSRLYCIVFLVRGHKFSSMLHLYYAHPLFCHFASIFVTAHYGAPTPPADPETDRWRDPIILRLGVLKKGECKTLCEKRLHLPILHRFLYRAPILHRFLISRPILHRFLISRLYCIVF
jgi:hypothetical protein